MFDWKKSQKSTAKHILRNGEIVEHEEHQIIGFYRRSFGDKWKQLTFIFKMYEFRCWNRIILIITILLTLCENYKAHYYCVLNCTWGVSDYIEPHSGNQLNVRFHICCFIGSCDWCQCSWFTMAKLKPNKHIHDTRAHTVFRNLWCKRAHLRRYDAYFYLLLNLFLLLFI